MTTDLGFGVEGERMNRKVGLRSGQRPVGYHASREGLNDLQDAQNEAARARRANRTSFRNRLQAAAEDSAEENEEAAQDETIEEERVTFHPGGPNSRRLKPGEHWRIKG